MVITKKTMVVFALVLLMMGCASTSWRQGRRYLEEEEYARAQEALTEALNEEPDNFKIHRDLGIAYYKAGQYERASEELEQAKQKLEKDGKVMFYLGMTYERVEQYDKAIEEYSRYTLLRRLSRVRWKMQQRVYWLIQQQADKWAKDRMIIEKQIDPASIPENTIAVTYFKPYISEDLGPLHKGLTDLLIADLSLVESLRVVERIKLKEIYDEIGLGSTDLVDQNTSPRMGRLLGASSIVTGTFTGFGERQWRIDPTLGLVKLGEFQTLDSVEGGIPEFLQVEKELVLDILEILSVELTQEERDSILANVPTRSLEAFLAYSRGLDYLDREMYPEAVLEFGSAISLDPGFSRAEENLTEAELLSQPAGSTDDLETVWDSTVSEERTKDELLEATVESTSQGDIDRTPGSEPEILDGQPEVELEVLIQW